ncbi:MAG: hypothetical protein K2Q32_05290 [Alphaproteobacteria bacterium]|nr:hypothetical protein [Alphaproteobacteria bacterium]
MNSFCKKLSEGLVINLGCEIAPLATKQTDGWHLKDKDGKDLGVFDLVISTAPPVQTLKLFAQQIPESAPFTNRPLQGCYTLMLGFNTPWNKSWIAAKVHDSPIEWIAINSTKPARNSNVTCIVVHSNNAWAEQHIDDDQKYVEDYLKSQFELIKNIKCAADYVSLHRWRYALLNEEEAVAPYFDGKSGLASTGDWCTASRIEDVWRSAMELVRQIQSNV